MKLDMDGQTHRETREAARDRTFQSRIEWLKTVYDFYKHFMTIAFTSIAAVLAATAFLGDTLKKTSGGDTPVIPTALLVLVAIVAFVAFLITGHASVQGMHLARINILHLHEVESEEDLTELRTSWRGGPNERWDSKTVWTWVRRSYATGSLAFGLYVVTSILMGIL